MSGQLQPDVSQVINVAPDRFRATFARRWRGYLSVVVLIGLTGGIAMASIAAGRRTQSSYPTFLASTNPSDVTVSVYAPVSGGAVPPLTQKMARLPAVTRVRTISAPAVVPLGVNGEPRLSTLATVTVLGSLDGLLSVQDRPGLVQGKMADPSQVDEMVMTATAAQVLGVHIGEVIPMGFYTSAQTGSSAFGSPTIRPRLTFHVRLVGIIVFNNSVIQDDVDRAYGFVLLTPALLRQVVKVSPPAAIPSVTGCSSSMGGRTFRPWKRRFSSWYRRALSPSFTSLPES